MKHLIIIFLIISSLAYAENKSQNQTDANTPCDSNKNSFDQIRNTVSPILKEIPSPNSKIIEPSFTPDCPILIFSWTPKDLSNSNYSQLKTFTVNHIVGAMESSHSLDIKNQDLCGQGMYFAGDPFSSQSYGDHLIIATIKPHQEMADLRPLGVLDDINVFPNAVDTITKSDSMLLVHNWIAKTGNAFAAVIRAKKDTKPEKLPIDLNNLYVLKVPEQQLEWKQHKIVKPNEPLQDFLTTYADKLTIIHEIWESWDEQPSKTLINKMLLGDIRPHIDSSEDNEPISIMEKYKLDLYESLAYPDSALSKTVPPEAVADIAKYLNKIGYLSKDNKAQTISQLNDDLIEYWKNSSNGYEQFKSAYDYLIKYKKSLGLKPRNLNNIKYTNPSTFETTCKPAN